MRVSQWTPEKDQKLIDLLLTGMTYKEAAKILKTTENACIGRGYRLRVKRDYNLLSKKQRAIYEYHDRKRIKPQTTFPPEGFCLWVLNEPDHDKKAKFCYMPVCSDSIYCSEHHKKAYRNPDHTPVSGVEALVAAVPNHFELNDSSSAQPS